MFLLALVISLGFSVVVLMHRNNEPRWRIGRHQTCCLDVPCSQKCAERRSALIVAGAVDGVRAGGPFRALVNMAEGLHDPGMLPAEAEEPRTRIR
jgi:hypothetical protein